MKFLEIIFGRKNDVVIAEEPTRWQVGDVSYMQDSTGIYFAVRGQVYCERGALVDPCEGESILLGGPEGDVIRRRMGI